MIKNIVFKYIILSLLSLSLVTVQAQDWTIALSVDQLECSSQSFCYSVLIKSHSEDFLLGSSNIRLFYNTKTQTYQDESIVLSGNKGYRISNDQVKYHKASLPGYGEISFEDHLGLIDIPIDFSGDQADAIQVTSGAYVPIASQVCFQSSAKQHIADPADFVWVSEKTKYNYTSISTTVNTYAGHTTDIEGSNFIMPETQTRGDCGVSALLTDASNYPNPFSESTSISFSLAHESPVSIVVYGSDGQLVLSEELNLAPGNHSYDIQQHQLNGSGIYIYKVKTPNNMVEKKMLLLSK